METISFAHGWNPSPEQDRFEGTVFNSDLTASDLTGADLTGSGLTSDQIFSATDSGSSLSQGWQKSLLPCIPPAVILMSLQAGVLPAMAATLTHGMNNAEVADLQAQLADLGYFQDHQTGYFGDRTEAAVKKFQESAGLVVDGIVGDQTRAALESKSTQIAISTPENSGFEGFAELTTLDLDLEDHPVAIDPAEVREIQTRLQNLGYNPGPIDGILGPKTEAAIRDFQAARGLIVDGIVGPQTQSALEQSVSESQGLSFETLPKMEDMVFSDLEDLGAEYEILPVPELPI
jgi:peptidoglycan hydrolase-like protein with peptidoglycan-binding domain